MSDRLPDALATRLAAHVERRLMQVEQIVAAIGNTAGAPIEMVWWHAEKALEAALLHGKIQTLYGADLSRPSGLERIVAAKEEEDA